ncbi:MAG: choice-of-anchor D domain-containing protein [Acidobacteria bacterium]|nr:choice-of-anchor D domain-containing protein [Acidobacteriota bacterium]
MTKQPRFLSPIWLSVQCASLLFIVTSVFGQSSAVGEGKAGLPEPDNEGPRTKSNLRMLAVASGTHSNNVRAAGGPSTGTQAELSMAVSGSNIVITFNGGPNGGGYVTSTDGGRTFGARTSPPRPMGANPCCDTGVAADNAGRFYYLELYRNDGAGNCTNSLHVSTNGGQTFGGIVGSPFSYGASTNFPDMPHLAIDRVNLVTGNPQLYVFSRHFLNGINCPQTGTGGNVQGEVVCSTNGGAAWTAPIVLAPFTDNAHMATGSDGSVYLVGNGIGTMMNTGSILLRRSTNSCNAGLNFGAPVTVADNQTFGGATNLDREFPQPYVAVDKLDPNIAYVAWSADRLTGVNDRDIFLARCVFTGLAGTCDAPVRINDDPIGSGNSQYFPMLCVDPNNKIQMSWNDQRAGGNSTAIFHSEITPVGAALSISRNFMISEVNFTPFNFGGTPDYGDYNENIEACDGQHYYAAWVSHVSPPGIIPASNDPDIFFAVVNNLQDIRVSGPLDFGDICVGDSQTRKLEVFNVGDAPLRITNVSRVAGSTAITVDANPVVPLSVGPGSHVDFNIRCAPTTTTPQTATIRVESDDFEQPVTNLTYTCNPSSPKMATAIADLGNFGNVCLGKFKDLDLTINNSGGCDLTISSIVSSLSVEFQVPNVLSFPLTIHPGDSIQIPIRFQPTTTGNRTATITINSNDPANPAQVVQVSGSGQAPMIVVPAMIDFGKVCPGETVTKTLNISNTGFCDLIVTNITSTNPAEFKVAPWVAFPLIVPPGSTRDVAIQFMPMGFTVNPMRMATLTIISNDPNTPMKDVKVTGIVPPPIIQAAPDPLDFGKVCLGKSKELLVTIRNTGECNLTVSSISFSSAEFKLASPPPFPFVIPPGGSRVVMVSFMPVGATGARMATMTINSDDPATPAKVITLKGEAPVSDIAITGPMDWGDVSVGKFRDQVLYITNTEACDLAVTLVCEVRGGTPMQASVEFNLVNPLNYPIIIPGGTTLPVRIRFKPERTGQRTANLFICGFDPQTPGGTTPAFCPQGDSNLKRTVTLTGRGK